MRRFWQSLRAVASRASSDHIGDGDLIALKVLVAMVRCPISMLLFYLQSALLAAVCIAAAVAVAQYNIWLPLALAPLYVGCLFLYARLLGRLAWRLSEKMTELEPTELQ